MGGPDGTQARQLTARGFLPVNGLGHDERLASGREVAHDPGVAEPTIQQEQLGPDARRDDPPPEFCHHVAHRRAGVHREDGEREAETVADNDGGGVAMEMRGAALGL